jgi:molecular chaperone GrpE
VANNLTTPLRLNEVKVPFKRKKMNQVDEHRENEDVTPAGPPFTPEISPETETSEASGLTKLQEELAETRDKFLRIYSEFDNYKRRTNKERLELIKSAGADVIISLLPVLDDFDRALKAMEKDESNGSNREGFELIYNKLKNILEQKGLKKMVSVGEDFNVDNHEAITNIPVADDNMKGKVVDEAESGYFLNDKVIRHAKVIVGA